MQFETEKYTKILNLNGMVTKYEAPFGTEEVKVKCYYSAWSSEKNMITEAINKYY